jgi:hypothetical protein
MSKFTCDECGERFDEDDQSKVYPELCESCGDSKLSDDVDDRMGDLQSIVDEWYEADRLANLDKLIAYADQFDTPAREVARALQGGTPP